jgi:hypothetical protein
MATIKDLLTDSVDFFADELAETSKATYDDLVNTASQVDVIIWEDATEYIVEADGERKIKTMRVDVKSCEVTAPSQGHILTIGGVKLFVFHITTKTGFYQLELVADTVTSKHHEQTIKRQGSR